MSCLGEQAGPQASASLGPAVPRRSAGLLPDTPCSDLGLGLLSDASFESPRLRGLEALSPRPSLARGAGLTLETVGPRLPCLATVMFRVWPMSLWRERGAEAGRRGESPPLASPVPAASLWLEQLDPPPPLPPAWGRTETGSLAPRVLSRLPAGTANPALRKPPSGHRGCSCPEVHGFGALDREDVGGGPASPPPGWVWRSPEA